jgi:GNAT superfamily N-acetyltransferase
VKFEIAPAHDLPLHDQALIFNRAFAGYLAGWHDINAEGLAKLICAQGIDLCHSRFVRTDGALAGFGYINRTGNISRLAGMGLVPEARRSGAAPFFLSQLLSEAKSRNDEAMVLEVFEQNRPGLTLYSRNNFRELMRLFGWRRPAQTIEIQVEGELEQISLLAASEICPGLDFPDIPWQISRYAVAKLADACAYRMRNVCVVAGDPAVTPARIYSLLGDGHGEPNGLRNVLAALIKAWPHTEFFAREIFPEEFGGKVFEPLGFAREPLNQILMRHDLQ